MNYSGTHKQRALLKIAAELATVQHKHALAKGLYRLVYHPEQVSPDQQQILFRRGMYLYLHTFETLEGTDPTSKEQWRMEVNEGIHGGANLTQIADALELREMLPSYRPKLNRVIHSGDLFNESAQNPLQDIYLQYDPRADDILNKVLRKVAAKTPTLKATRSKRGPSSRRSQTLSH